MGLLGTSKDRAWKQLAQELGAEALKGGLFGCKAVHYTYKGYKIILDTYIITQGLKPVHYTIIKVQFNNKKEYSLDIQRRNTGSQVETLHMEEEFGKIFDFSGGGGSSQSIKPVKSVTIGHDKFDKFISVMSNMEKETKEMLSNNELMKLVFQHKLMNLKIVTSKNSGERFLLSNTNGMIYRCKNIIEDVQALKSLFELFTTFIDALEAREMILPLE